MMNLTRLHPVSALDVRVVGIGGAGCSTLVRLRDSLPGDTGFLAIDTGSGTTNLPGSDQLFIQTISIGNGFGSGGDPEAAADQFAGDARNNIELARFVDSADVVIIVAGLGSGTGSGIAPLVAKASTESGTLTLAVVNMPFEFEGRFRSHAAELALNNLQDASDSVFVTRNDHLLKSAKTGGSVSLNDAFTQADRTISNSIRGVVAALEASEESFDEIQRSLQQRGGGKSVLISGSSSGLHAGKSAVESAFGNLDSDPFPVGSTVIHVEGGIGLSSGQITEAVTATRSKIGQLADMQVSSVRDIALGQTIRVTLILAGARSVPTPTETGRNIPIRKPTAPVNQIELQQSATLSMFDTPQPLRKRGPVLLPVS